MAESPSPPTANPSSPLQAEPPPSSASGPPRRATLASSPVGSRPSEWWGAFLVLALVVGSVLSILAFRGMFLTEEVISLPPGSQALVRVENAPSAGPALIQEVPALPSTVDSTPKNDPTAVEVRALREALAQLQTSVARTQHVALAFTDVRIAARLGEHLSRPLAALRKALGPEATVPSVAAALESLQPWAEQNVPSQAQLMSTWETLTPRVRAALSRAQATTWGERVRAEIRGLITVRSLDDQPPRDAVTAVQRTLESGAWSDALREIATWPEAAQAVLTSWTAEAEARQSLDAALTSLATVLIETPPTPLRSTESSPSRT